MEMRETQPRHRTLYSTRMAGKLLRDGRLWLLALMTILVVFFSYPAAIHNALTHAPEKGYEIHISVWRILFEPFFGPLIFLLRTPNALTLYAGMFILAVVLSWQSLRRSGPVQPRLRHWFNAAAICSLLFLAVLLVAIIAPLPVDVIRNQNQDIILLNPHSHSHYSHDGLVSPDRLMTWHAQQGFDAFFITDHNQHENTLALVAEQRAGRITEKPLVLAGMEYSGSNHILLLGLTRPFNSKDYPDQTAIDTCHAQRGAAVIAHWFTPSRQTHDIPFYIAAGCDGFEIVNKANGAFNAGSSAEPVIAACNRAQLIMMAGCDWHGYGQACQSWTGLTIPGWHDKSQIDQQESILEIFRRHQQDKIAVLVLHDRPSNSLPVWLQPALFFLDYSRSLNYWQLASWFVWLLVLGRCANRRRLFRVASVASLIFIVVLGFYWLFTGYSLQQYNKVLLSYGRSLLILGLALAFFTRKFFKKN